jgi:hypothetical protein
VFSEISLRDPEGAVLRQDLRLRPPLPKTNFPSLTIIGQVDDALTTVLVNGLPALRDGRRFSLTLPMPEGKTATRLLNVLATSVNEHVSRQAVQVVHGTIPVLQAIQPLDRSKLFIGTTVSVTGIASDQEQDPLSYTFVIDGRIVRKDTPDAAFPWPLTEAQRGRHTVEVRVRDAYGGSVSATTRAYVLRAPVHAP